MTCHTTLLIHQCLYTPAVWAFTRFTSRPIAQLSMPLIRYGGPSLWRAVTIISTVIKALINLNTQWKDFAIYCLKCLFDRRKIHMFTVVILHINDVIVGGVCCRR